MINNGERQHASVCNLKYEGDYISSSNPQFSRLKHFQKGLHEIKGQPFCLTSKMFTVKCNILVKSLNKK